MAKKGFVCTQATEKVGLIKKDLLAEKQDLFEKKVWGKVPSQEKKVLCYKKKGIAEAKKCKNRIIWEKQVMVKTEKRRISSHPTVAIWTFTFHINQALCSWFGR
jgi:hypothetical protein